MCESSVFLVIQILAVLLLNVSLRTYEIIEKSFSVCGTWISNVQKIHKQRRPKHVNVFSL